MLRVSLQKDNHVFTVHRIDPVTDVIEQTTESRDENLADKVMTVTKFCLASKCHTIIINDTLCIISLSKKLSN